MERAYKPFIGQTVGEINDMLAGMMLSSPTFKDAHLDMMFPGRDLGGVFFELNESLGVVRKKLGEKRYQTLMEMSDRMRAHFEADPEDTNGRAKEGRKIIREMKELLRRRSREPANKSHAT